ncbi:branched-chain amino acid ABC transporter permease [Chroogloeocystis siderophila]|jgi:neutral amino acid transport system permease protein|uniref:Branched-chain amino acid ABC transporter permease n=1 Tax=Chroogloeocystis siderophila 5.2 s.c.1 TaxID=247279 RepID=A0A1U7HK82_9CHRO|nr:branched-chain amino acid ABC transporter permease [Chroogloeocystis siderophila]OKH23979.1 branched-chain amino acid ABC transporter permease [Chroogloeocystis siderophila 5.2 s.c.1]
MIQNLSGWVGYLIFLIISTAVFALFSLGLNLQWGFTGLINFGHVAFMTIGAYTTVLLTLHGVPLIIAALVGAGAAALLGLIIGLSTLRLRQDYLAIVTIGVSELLRLVVNNQDLPTGNGFTPGSFGVQGYPLPLVSFDPTLLTRLGMIALLTLVVGVCYWRLWKWVVGKAQQKLQKLQGQGNALPVRNFLSRLMLGVLAAGLILVLFFAGAIALYNYTSYANAGLMLISVLVLALVFWRLEVLVRSPWGRVLKAIREDEDVATALGKNVFWYKLQALMLGGAIAGVSGALLAWQLTTIYPDNFQPQITFDAWTMVILGGAGNNVGTLLGAVVYWAYDAITRFALPAIFPLDEARLGAFRIMVIGLILMLLMLWRPQGILGKKEELTLGK